VHHTLIFIEMLTGFSILIRVLHSIRTKSLISESAMTKIVAAFVACEALLAFLPINSQLAFTLCWSVPLVFIVILPSWIQFERRRHFKLRRIWILNSLILRVRLGSGVRQALLQTSERADLYIKTRLRQLHDRLVTTNNISAPNEVGRDIDPLLIELYDVLVDCERESHLTCQRLTNYRRKIEIHEEFQRKSDQVLRQLRAQAYVLTALYFAVFGFVVWRFGFTEHSRTLVMSMSLFILGIIITLRQGRRIRWTV